MSAPDPQAWLTGTLVVGLAATFAQGVPQAVRTVVHRRVAGLSPTGLWAVLLLNAVWLAYAATVGDRLLLAGNVVTTGCAAAVLATYRRLGRARPTRLDAVGALLLVAVAATAALGQDRVLASTAALLGVLWGLPQLVKLVVTRQVDGVSPVTYLVALVGVLAWGAHWFLAHEPLLLASCAYTAALLVASLALLAWRTRRPAAVPVPA